MSVWKHFPITNIWMIRDGVSFEWCFQHQISVSWTQGGIAVNWCSPQSSGNLFSLPRKKNGNLKITVLIHLNHPPPFLDWYNYSTTSFERFHIQLRSLVVARLIWFALERLATRRVCILWEYSSAGKGWLNIGAALPVGGWWKQCNLGGGSILTNVFQMGWNHQLVILAIFVGIFSILPTGAGNWEVSLKRQRMIYYIICSFAYKLSIIIIHNGPFGYWQTWGKKPTWDPKGLYYNVNYQLYPTICRAVVGNSSF